MVMVPVERSCGREEWESTRAGAHRKKWTCHTPLGLASGAAPSAAPPGQPPSWPLSGRWTRAQTPVCATIFPTRSPACNHRGWDGMYAGGGDGPSRVGHTAPQAQGLSRLPASEMVFCSGSASTATHGASRRRTTTDRSGCQSRFLKRCPQGSPGHREKEVRQWRQGSPDNGFYQG
jgi:hypothetical protein